MGLLDAIAELLAPTRCAGCDLPGALLCPACDESLPRIATAQSCPRCGAPYGALVCTECWDTTYAFDAAIVLGELDGALARAVVLHKDAGERRLGPLLGGMLAKRVTAEWGEWADAVTWVPATRAAVNRRGFDHAQALARPVADALGLPPEPLLSRAAARDQRRLGRAERSANSAGTFGARTEVRGNVLVIDDVFTTGATLDAAASALLGAGACAVRVAAVARAW